MKELTKQLSISGIEGLQTLTVSSVHKHGAAGILHKYNNSLGSLLSALFPEYKQACRDYLTHTASNLKLSSVTALSNIPKQYRS